MNIDPNDPRLTAFVLGELDPTERAVVEAMLIESAECRQAVEEIRLTTQWLSEQLHEESRAHWPAARARVINHQAVAETLLEAGLAAARRWWRLTAGSDESDRGGLLVARGPGACCRLFDSRREPRDELNERCRQIRSARRSQPDGRADPTQSQLGERPAAGCAGCTASRRRPAPARPAARAWDDARQLARSREPGQGRLAKPVRPRRAPMSRADSRRRRARDARCEACETAWRREVEESGRRWPAASSRLRQCRRTELRDAAGRRDAACRQAASSSMLARAEARWPDRVRRCRPSDL